MMRARILVFCSTVLACSSPLTIATTREFVVDEGDTEPPFTESDASAGPATVDVLIQHELGEAGPNEGGAMLPNNGKDGGDSG